jgi:2-polyprenyl-3-methyl-5-hydroxy-6-metoxy-1,4-benzoquinol methylase
MNYPTYKKYYNLEADLFWYLYKKADSLYIKLSSLNINTLNISDYNKRYLKMYIDEYDFFKFIYIQLLGKAIKELSKPVEFSIFVDYGGGCGILSFLAKEIGFKTVIYNDIYEVSVEDFKTIGTSIELEIDYSICGDINNLCEFLKISQIRIDILCSMDVLEHIYNIDNWFTKANEIEGNYSIIFLTSANSRNPFIRKKLIKIHKQAEYVGSPKTEGWKERDLNKPFLQVRSEIISELVPDLEIEKINFLAESTRGLMIYDIKTVVKDYLQTGNLGYKILHPTNTCDPFTGNWSENLINLKFLTKIVSSKGFDVRISNSFYSYSRSKIANFFKLIFNFLMFTLGEKLLIISPSYTLIARKKD